MVYMNYSTDVWSRGMDSRVQNKTSPLRRTKQCNQISYVRLVYTVIISLLLIALEKRKKA